MYNTMLLKTCLAHNNSISTVQRYISAATTKHHHSHRQLVTPTFSCIQSKLAFDQTHPLSVHTHIQPHPIKAGIPSNTPTVTVSVHTHIQPYPIKAGIPSNTPTVTVSVHTHIQPHPIKAVIPSNTPTVSHTHIQPHPIKAVIPSNTPTVSQHPHTATSATSSQSCHSIKHTHCQSTPTAQDQTHDLIY